MNIEKKEAEIYNFIINYVEEHLYSPTVREICNGVGLKSTSSVSYRLKRLQKRGLIEYNRMEPRTIKILGYKLIECNKEP